LRQLTTGKNADVEEILANARELTRDAREALAGLRGTFGEGEEAMGPALSRLSRSLDHLESIVRKIDHGEGALGKLISDERLGEQVATAVEGVRNYVTRVN